MTYTPPSYNFTNPHEARQAVRWVLLTSQKLDHIMSDGGAVSNAYPTLIRDIIHAGHGGDYRARCLSFVEGAIALREPAYAEYVHDLMLMTEYDIGPAAYATLINDLFTRAKGGYDGD